jgi:hypothetical protein
MTAVPFGSAVSEAARAERRRTLRGALEAGLTRRRDRPARIVDLERHALEMRSTHPIDRLDVRLDSGEQLRVVFKRLRRGCTANGDRREVLVYRRLLEDRRFGAPMVYASVYDDICGNYWLFLEDLGESTLLEGDRDAWLAAVRWLAQMHGRWWARAAELRALDCLDEHGPRHYWRIARTARRHIVRAGHPPDLHTFDRLMAAFPSVVDHLVRQPRTLVHGDVFPHNILLQPGPRIRPIDWESAAVGLAAWDLARLLDGWGSDKPGFTAAYLSELARRLPIRCDSASFEQTLAHCEILVVLSHLAWDEKACRADGFVLGRLQALETAFHHLDHGKKRG